MSITSSAEQIATRQHHKLTKRAVIYRRGGVEIPIEASPLRLSQTVEQAEGSQVKQQVPYWLILPETLDFGDGATEPKLGDEVVDGTAVYQVQGSGNVRSWDWETPSQLRFKVRTVQA